MPPFERSRLSSAADAEGLKGRMPGFFTIT
jgi:hypothetical protein